MCSVTVQQSSVLSNNIFACQPAFRPTDGSQNPLNIIIYVLYPKGSQVKGIRMVYFKVSNREPRSLQSPACIVSAGIGHISFFHVFFGSSVVLSWISLSYTELYFVFPEEINNKTHVPPFLKCL